MKLSGPGEVSSCRLLLEAGGLRVGLGLRLRLCLSGRACSVMVGLQLLHLVGREDGGELLPGLLVDGFHLLLHGFVGDCGVVS